MASGLIKHFRPSNLLIILISQWIVYGLIAQAPLEPSNFIYFLCTNVLIIAAAAAGYISNDLLNVSEDIVNKNISKPEEYQTALFKLKPAIPVLYLLGLIAAAWLSYQFARPTPIIWSVGITTALEVYNRYAKRIPVIGNLIVSGLCAAAVLVLIELPNIKQSLASDDIRMLLFLTFGIWAFFLTWLREIAKDVEDMSGDAQSGIHTYPVAHGLKSTRNYVIMVLAGFGLTAGWLLRDCIETLPVLAALLAVFFIYLCTLLLKANLYHPSPEDQIWSRIGKSLKHAMLAGMLITLISGWYYLNY